MVSSVAVLFLAAVTGAGAATTGQLGYGFLKLEDDASNDALQLTQGSGSSKNLICASATGATNCALLQLSSAGNMDVASLDVTGAITKGSGSFDIPHPLPAREAAGYRLRHSFVEAPRADNIYTGAGVLNASAALRVDLDAAFGMTTGTFAALNRDLRVLATGSGCVVSYGAAGATLDLAGDAGGAKPWLCGPGDAVTYQVVGERRDKHMVEDSGMMDADGNFIPEYVREENAPAPEGA